MNLREVGITGSILACLVVTGCAAGFRATYDYDRDHDFSDLGAWTWISDEPMKISSTVNPPSPLLQPRIMAAIEDELAGKGYRKVDSEDAADFVVAFTVGSREEIKVDTYPSMYGGYAFPGRWGGPYYGISYGTETRVRQYDEGMLAIDVFDVAERKPVWHGVVTKSITDADRAAGDEPIRAGVAAVLESFPPP